MISLDATLFVQVAVFLAFTLFLYYSLLRPLGRYFARRQAALDQLRSATVEHGSDFENLHRQYLRKIAAAKETVLAQRTAARKKAMEIHNAMLEKSKKQAHREIIEAERELRREVTEARMRLADESRALAGTIYHKVMGRKVNT